jgi:hypothetical protein
LHRDALLEHLYNQKFKGDLEMTENAETFQTDVDEIKEKAKALLDEGKGLVDTMNELKEWKNVSDIMENMSTLSNFVTKVVCAVKVAADDINSDVRSIQSGAKLEAAVQILDDMIKLPWYLEYFDGIAIKMVINTAVDFLDKTLGEDWGVDTIKDYVLENIPFLSAEREVYMEARGLK